MQRSYFYRLAVLFSLALLYAGLSQKYRAYDVDTPWFLSFSYNACHNHVETDMFREVHYPGGMDGVHLFGKLPAAIQCSAMNLAGWTPTTALTLNLLFGIASLWLWWSLLMRLGYGEGWITCFILLLGVTEPMVSMMEKARYEFFAFFLLSVALWLGIQGLELLSILVALIAVEAEPAALAIAIVTVVLLALRTNNGKLLTIKCGIASILVLAVYLSIHPGAISEMVHSSHPRAPYFWGGTLRIYYVERRRHLPELGMLLLAGLLYWRHWRSIPERTGIWLALASGAFFLFAPHPNPSYMVFAMPFLLWAAVDAYYPAKLWRRVPALVFLSALLQYVYLYRINIDEGFDAQDFDRVRDRIGISAGALQIPDARLHICGDYSLWFSHPQNYSTCFTTDTGSVVWNANLVLCLDEPLQGSGLSSPDWLSCSKIEKIIPIRELSSMTIRGHVLHFYGRG